jgi:hypothetical protein
MAATTGNVPIGTAHARSKKADRYADACLTPKIPMRQSRPIEIHKLGDSRASSPRMRASVALTWHLRCLVGSAQIGNLQGKDCQQPLLQNGLLWILRCPRIQVGQHTSLWLMPPARLDKLPPGRAHWAAHCCVAAWLKLMAGMHLQADISRGSHASNPRAC